MTRARLDGRLDLDRDVFDALVQHARSDYPYEVCGLLAGKGGRITKHYAIPNAARSMTFYKMDAKALLHAMNDMDDHEWDLAAIYHSHTHTEAFPSATDIELAFYPDAAYLIVSLQDDEPVIRGFNIVDGAVSERTVYVDGAKAPVGSR